MVMGRNGTANTQFYLSARVLKTFPDFGYLHSWTMAVAAKFICILFTYFFLSNVLEFLYKEWLTNVHEKT